MRIRTRRNKLPKSVAYGLSVGAVMLVLSAIQVQAQTEQAKLTASDGARSDSFGTAVAIDGNTAVIGADEHDDNGDFTGSAYVFRFDDASGAWFEEQELLPDDGATFGRFGRSVAISGDVAVIGTRAPGVVIGSAYVFRFDGFAWVQEQELLASDGAGSDDFGFAVAIDGDTAVIGAPGDDDNGSRSGSVYVFRFDGTAWNEEAKLTASDGAAGDSLGGAVAVSGDAAVVGAFDDDDFGFRSGAAYMYRFDGVDWNQEAKLTASNAGPSQGFGSSVSIDGDVAVIGQQRFQAQQPTHSLYVFRFDGISWDEEAKIDDPYPDSSAVTTGFGDSVSISNDVFVAGALFSEVMLCSDTLESCTTDNECNVGTCGLPSGPPCHQFRECLPGNCNTSGGGYPVECYSDSDCFEDPPRLCDSPPPEECIGGAVCGVIPGSAYLYVFDGTDWNLEARLLSSDAAEFDLFGWAVSISGGVVGIGAIGANDFKGSVYIFDVAPALCMDPDPRSQGYWHRQCLGVPASEGGLDPGLSGRGPQSPTEPGFFPGLMECALLKLGSFGFSGQTACEGMDASPPSDSCDRAEKQLTALVFNVCSGRLTHHCEIDLEAEGCASTRVDDLLGEIAHLISGGECHQAQSCAEAVNTGRALVSGKKDKP